MRERTMNWYFEPRRDNGGTRQHEDDSAPGLISIPVDVLQRHGALVLDPGQAVAVRDDPTPRSTVYRARSLLVPGTLLRDDNAAPVNEVLAGVGMKLAVPAQGVEPQPSEDGEDGRLGNEGVARILGLLPRPVALTVADNTDDTTARPVVIDAWVALQALRAAVVTGKRHRLRAEEVAGISLEHLLVGSAITGSPASGSGGGLAAGPSDGGGVTGPTTTDSYTYSGGDTRAPVALCLPMPIRECAEKYLGVYGRRPVLAVVDTGVRAHPWLDVVANPGGGYDTDETDGFVAVDFPVQDAIFQASQQAAEAGDLPREPIDGPWDRPVTADPLVGELDTDTGHGTFIAGLVRQIVPDATVLALRVMHSDGVVYEGDLLCALGRLAARVALAEAGTGTGIGSMATMVDVVSLSLGYFDETADDASFSTGLLQVIDLLLSLGVPVVAAAGNYATSRKFFPAAFTQSPPPAGQVPLISVGALNPNGSKALFSDGGRWVTAWAPGAAVVSTFPVDLNGSRSPELRMPAHPANEMPPGVSLPPEREALDPDDYRGGFAIWSGTSFSAPLVAARITKALLDQASDPALGLGLPGAQAATTRAQAALADLRAGQGLDGPG
jgi:hypothetical protein